MSLQDYNEDIKAMKAMSEAEREKGNHDLSRYLYSSALKMEELCAMLQSARNELLAHVKLESKQKCFHCGSYEVVWDSDFSFADYCEEGNGIIHECHCAECGARITYRIPLEDPFNDED